jgi:hypothetical protein
LVTKLVLDSPIITCYVFHSRVSLAHSEKFLPIQKGTPMPTAVEVLGKSGLLLHIPEEHGPSVRVLVGAGDGPLVYIDASGPILRTAVSNVLEGIQTISRFANQAGARAAGSR